MCDQEEIKEIVGRLSKLKYELQTDKPLTEVKDQLPDSSRWNRSLDWYTFFIIIFSRVYTDHNVGNSTIEVLLSKPDLNLTTNHYCCVPLGTC